MHRAGPLFSALGDRARRIDRFHNDRPKILDQISIFRISVPGQLSHDLGMNIISSKSENKTQLPESYHCKNTNHAEHDDHDCLQDDNHDVQWSCPQGIVVESEADVGDTVHCRPATNITLRYKHYRRLPITMRYAPEVDWHGQGKNRQG